MAVEEAGGLVGVDVRLTGALTALFASLPALVREEERRTVMEPPTVQRRRTERCLHGREVLGLVDDDVAMSRWGVATDQHAEPFEADVVVGGPRIGVGAGGAGSSPSKEGSTTRASKASGR